MATIKFSEFDPGNITAVGAQVVGLEGGNNKIFNAADLVNGLATTSYVDAQDTNLQNQITQNANDIANIDIDVGNIEVDTSEIESNITILQGQVTVIEGNIVVLEGAVAALQNNVTVNTDDITTIQGNIVQIENDLANINYSNANVQALGESGWTGNIVPSANITYDLGNTTNRWKDLYLSNATIYLGSTELSTANGVITVDGKKVKNTFGTTTSIVNTSTDVYNRNGPLPADPKGMAVADPNGKSGWYWKSPGPTANPSGLNAFQWKMFNNDGPQTFTVADIDYIYMIVDLYTTGQVYFNVFTAGINPAPTAFQSRFSFVYGGTFPSTGRYLMWAKPPGSDITVDDVEVYPFLERLELPYSASGSSGTLLTSETIKSLNVQTRSNPALNEGEVEFTLKNVGYKVNNSYIQNFDMEIYGGDQSLSLDNSSNVLSISGGNSVDFTPVLANVSGGGGSGNYGDANVAAYLNGNLSTSIIPDTNSAYDIGSAEYKIRHLYLSDNSLYFVDASNTEYPLNVQGGSLFFNGEQVSGGGGGNPFDQSLNTTDDVTFNAVTVNGNMDVNGSGTHAFQGTIEFSQLTNFGGTVGITDILNEPD